MQHLPPLLFGLFLCLPGTLRADTLYVNAEGIGSNTGTTWIHAFFDLQSALAVASSGDEIWVAAGTYYPGTERTSSFQLQDNIAIYGGFKGNETARHQRDANPETNNTVLSGDIGVRGQRGDNSYHVVDGTGADNGAILDGFTIRDGNASVTEKADFNSRGGGLICSTRLSTPVLRNLLFVDNEAYFVGGGAYLNNAEPTFEHVTFLNCRTVLATASGSVNGEGGAVYINQADVAFTYCRFLGNSSTSRGGAVSHHGSDSRYTNCLFSGNSAILQGGGIYSTSGSEPVLTNCTLAGNTAGISGSAIFQSETGWELINTLIWGNGPAPISSSGANSNSYSHSLVEGVAPPGVGNLNGSDPGNDPLFIDAAGPDNIPGTLDDNLRLPVNSPGVDRGQNAGIMTPWDLDTLLRIRNFTIDLGAYETSRAVVAGLTNVFLPQTASGEARTLEGWSPSTIQFNGGAGFTYTFSPQSGDLAFVAPPSVSSDGTLSFVLSPGTSGFAQFELIVSDSSSIFLPSDPILFSISLNPVHVDSAAGGSATGTTWADAYPSLQDALRATVLSGVEIWVAEGIHYPDAGAGQIAGDRTASFMLRDGVALYGGFDGTETELAARRPHAVETVLSGNIQQDDTNENNSYHVLLADASAIPLTSSTLVDGFTITGGYADGSNEDSSGGGFLCRGGAHPSFSHCRFRENFAEDSGGAVYNSESSPNFENCSFEHNESAGNGGAIYSSFDSSPALTGCRFVGNSATLNGGGVFIWRSTLTLVDGHFQGNRARRGSCLFIDANTSPRFSNCVFLGNEALQGSACVNVDASPAFVNCSFQGNRSTEMNFGATFVNFGGFPSLLNCVMWNNLAGETTSSQNASVFDSSSLGIFVNCLIENWDSAMLNNHGPGGGNNLDGTDAANNPLFAKEVDPLDAPHLVGGNLRLLTGSPALDVGLNRLNSEPLDLAGNPRIQNATIDLGAYEGAFVTFAHLGYLNPAADDNLNGLTNYTDYALGGDPTAPHDPDLQPSINGNQLTFSFRNNAADVFVAFQKSGTLLPDSWVPMFPGTDYTLGNETIAGTTTTLDLELLTTDPTLFFRESLSETAP
jgi:predicted outer membrane repeat protein